MARCINCQVEVLDHVEVCPLCRAVLEQTEEMEEMNMYPDVRPHVEKITFNLRLYLFFALLLEAGLVFLDVWHDGIPEWSIVIGVALLYLYVIWQQAVLGRTSYKNKVSVLCVLGAVFILCVDFSLGYRGWSVAYVLPAAVLVIDAILVFLMLKHETVWQSYIMAQLWMILCSVILCGIAHKMGTIEKTVWIPLIVSVLLFVGTMVIGGRRARSELKRRFHTR